MHVFRIALLVSSLSLCGLAPLQADELQMHSVGEQKSMEAVPRPTRGLTMAQVEQRFGEPQEKLPAVGKPPITRWVYGNYTVYFEHQYVLHSVVHHGS